MNVNYQIRSLEDLQRELFRRAVRAAVTANTETYLSGGGVLRNKTKKQLQIDRTILDELVKVVWVANNYKFTSHYWHMEVVKAAKEEA